MPADPVSSLQQLNERARRLLRRATEFLGGPGEEAPTEGVEPVRMALEKLEQLLVEGTDAVVAELKASRRDGDARAGTSDPKTDARVMTILEVTRALSHVVEENVLFELIMDLVIEHSKAERGFFLLRDEAGEFTIRAARDFDQETIQEAEREISRSVIERVREGGEPLFVPNALADASLKLKESVAALKILSVLCAPMSLDGEILGIVYLESRSVTDLFDDADREFIRLFCEQAAIALRNARAYREARDVERRLEDENVRLRAAVAERHSFAGIIGRSRRMQELYALLERVSPKPVSVLVRGENGTGKELIARVMHYNSPRAKGPFVSVNCAALPETLIESELFGIEKGTATGVDARAGKFEVASGGTLFLDEVGDMSLVTQAKLLRVLQEREIERVGGRSVVPVDVRVVAATNVDLEQAIADKVFREDLYYRLNVVPVMLPALRERTEDIPLLVKHFLEKLGSELDAEDRRLTADALDCLVRYEWPGNVRQLENVIAHALVLSQSEEIGVAELPPEIQDAVGKGGRRLSLEGATLDDLEQAAVLQALEKNDWVQTRAATELGITERNLRYKMKKFGIERRRRGSGATEGASVSPDAVAASVAAARDALGAEPVAGLVLGSGLGGFADGLDERRSVPTGSLPHFPVSTVSGHAGQLVAGRIEGVPVVVLQGRVHGYEGYAMGEVTWAVRVMAGLGARGLVLTNAAGAMTTRLAPGDLMLVRDHVNLSFQKLLTPDDLEDRVPLARGGRAAIADPFAEGVYAPRLAACAREAARQAGIALREGVLVYSRGPTYETPREVALYRMAGDAACMSTVPEALVARLLGLEVMALSCVSNLGTGLSATPLTHDEVTTIAARVSGRFAALLRGTIARAYGDEGGGHG